MKKYACLQNINWKQLSILPLLFVFLASGCGKKSGDSTPPPPPPNPGFGDFNVTVYYSDGKTPLPGYGVDLVSLFRFQAYIKVDTQNSQLTTDKNGKAHLHIEFVNKTIVSSATLTLVVNRSGCTLNCGVGENSFDLGVGQTQTVSINTDVDVSAAAPAEKSQASTSSLNIMPPVPGNPLEGGHRPVLVTSPNDPTQYVAAISNKGNALQPLNAEASMTNRSSDKAPTLADAVRPHAGDVVVVPIPAASGK